MKAVRIIAFLESTEAIRYSILIGLVLVYEFSVIVLSTFATTPSAFIFQPPFMPPLPPAFTGRDFWAEVPKLCSTSAIYYVVGRDRNSVFPLEYEAVSRLAYPSIENVRPEEEGWLNDRSFDAYMELMERDIPRKRNIPIRCYHVRQTRDIGQLRDETAMERVPHRHPFHISAVNPLEYKWLLFPICLRQNHFIMIAFNSATTTLTVMDSQYSVGFRPDSEHFVTTIRCVYCIVLNVTFL
jgi:hypothetical protein